MKRLCFGTLMRILYQARNQGVTNDSLCNALFGVYGATIDMYDGSLSGHLKSGHDNVPPDVIDSARTVTFGEADIAFRENVVSLIRGIKHESVVRAIKDVLREDTNIPDEYVVGYISGYEKSKILSSSTFSLSALLASVFRYAIVEVSNKSCEVGIKEIKKDYVDSFNDSAEKIFFESSKTEKQTPLKKTLYDPTFAHVFEKVSSVTVLGLDNESNAHIYGVDINNCKFRFRKLKEYLIDNIGSYVFSRATADRYNNLGKTSAIGSQALIRFLNAYGSSAETVLGEMLLYVFMEQELNAPKIMSKIEINDLRGAASSRSDGIHLLATEKQGSLFHQLVFGASDIVGNLTAAIDRVFEKILEIDNNSDLELKMVENTTYNNIYDSETTEYMINLLVPKKDDGENKEKPDMAFGVFLGYTLSLDIEERNNEKFRVAVKEQMKKDISAIQPYIEKKIIDNRMSGYSFYFYVVPFNDAMTERENIIDEMLKGGF